MKKTNTKYITAIISAIIILFALWTWLFWKIQNWNCNLGNNYCWQDIQKIWEQIDIIGTSINQLEFDENLD